MYTSNPQLKGSIMNTIKPAVDLSNFSVSTLPSSMLVFNLSLSVWTGRKIDKRVSEEVDVQKSTKTRAGNYSKNLFAGAGKLDEITKLAGACRNYVYSMTQPWGDNGDRVLNKAVLTDFMTKLTDYERDFSRLTNEFLGNYDMDISAAAFQLGDLFNRNDYPTKESVANKFAFRYTITPLPTSGDFRVDIGNEGLRELQEQYERVLNERVTGAMTDAWERLHDALTRMSERLTDTLDENGEPVRKIFKNSLVGNAVEVCELLKTFNITGDLRMDEMRKQLEDTLRGVDAQTLRDSDYVRQETKRKVDAMLDKF